MAKKDKKKKKKKKENSAFDAEFDNPVAEGSTFEIEGSTPGRESRDSSRSRSRSRDSSDNVIDSRVLDSDPSKVTKLSLQPPDSPTFPESPRSPVSCFCQLDTCKLEKDMGRL